LIGAVSSLLVGYSIDLMASSYLGYLWQSLGYGFAMLLAFAIGVFASLWLLTPLQPSLRVSQVVLCGLLAAAVGAVLVLVVSFAFGMIGPMSGSGPLFGYSFPWPDLGGALQAATMALQAAIGAFVQQAPVVILVVVLAWLWLQKHPSAVAVSAASAEV
jgi:hypothetical protein